MTSDLAARIRARREALGRAPAEVAASIPISEASYVDLEHFSEDATTLHGLERLRTVGRELNWTIWELLDLAPPQHAPVISRSQLIRTKREEAGMSIDELAEFIGYGPETTAKLEMDDGSFVEWFALADIEAICSALNIPLSALVDDSPARGK